MIAIGTHCLLELHGCPAALLDDRDALARALRAAADRAGAQLIHYADHHFEPQGITAVGLLAESHISIHTWPELGYAAADVFTCGASTRPELACEVLVGALEASHHELSTLRRGPRVARPPRAPRSELVVDQAAGGRAQAPEVAQQLGDAVGVIEGG